MYTHPQQDRLEVKRRRKEVGQWLKGKRLEAEKTQKDIAKEVGFEYYTMVSQIEGGHARIPPEALEQYAKSLKISPRQFTKTVMYYYDPLTWDLLFSPDKK